MAFFDLGRIVHFRGDGPHLELRRGLDEWTGKKVAGIWHGIRIAHDASMAGGHFRLAAAVRIRSTDCDMVVLPKREPFAAKKQHHFFVARVAQSRAHSQRGELMFDDARHRERAAHHFTLSALRCAFLALSNCACILALLSSGDGTFINDLGNLGTLRRPERLRDMPRIR
jgi:hypothetical protein